MLWNTKDITDQLHCGIWLPCRLNHPLKRIPWQESSQWRPHRLHSYLLTTLDECWPRPIHWAIGGVVIPCRIRPGGGVVPYRTEQFRDPVSFCIIMTCFFSHSYVITATCLIKVYIRHPAPSKKCNYFHIIVLFALETWDWYTLFICNNHIL